MICLSGREEGDFLLHLYFITFLSSFNTKIFIKKNVKRATHKSIRNRVKNAIKHEKYELLYDEYVGKNLKLDYWILDYVYFSKEELENSDLKKDKINKLISK